eukprot:jgi/Bigna1/76911/fgenesh1_pg.44_\
MCISKGEAGGAGLCWGMQMNNTPRETRLCLHGFSHFSFESLSSFSISPRYGSFRYEISRKAPRKQRVGCFFFQNSSPVCITDNKLPTFDTTVVETRGFPWIPRRLLQTHAAVWTGRNVGKERICTAQRNLLKPGQNATRFVSVQFHLESLHKGDARPRRHAGKAPTAISGFPRFASSWPCKKLHPSLEKIARSSLLSTTWDVASVRDRGEENGGLEGRCPSDASPSREPARPKSQTVSSLGQGETRLRWYRLSGPDERILCQQLIVIYLSGIPQVNLYNLTDSITPDKSKYEKDDIFDDEDIEIDVQECLDSMESFIKTLPLGGSSLSASGFCKLDDNYILKRVPSRSRTRHVKVMEHLSHIVSKIGPPFDEFIRDKLACRREGVYRDGGVGGGKGEVGDAIGGGQASRRRRMPPALPNHSVRARRAGQLTKSRPQQLREEKGQKPFVKKYFLPFMARLARNLKLMRTVSQQ